jgi:hypothetical protein
MGKKTKERPTRYRVMRKDTSISSAAAIIEKQMGLPAGSVKLVLPSGRKARDDSRVENLLKRWDY